MRPPKTVTPQSYLPEQVRGGSEVRLDVTGDALLAHPQAGRAVGRVLAGDPIARVP